MLPSIDAVSKRSVLRLQSGKEDHQDSDPIHLPSVGLSVEHLSISSSRGIISESKHWHYARMGPEAGDDGGIIVATLRT